MPAGTLISHWRLRAGKRHESALGEALTSPDCDKTIFGTSEWSGNWFRATPYGAVEVKHVRGGRRLTYDSGVENAPTQR